MKNFIFTILAITFLLSPFSVFADCKKEGTTIVFINGIFGDIKSAQDNLSFLNREYNSKYKNSNIKFVLGFNESHIVGVDDLGNVVEQIYKGSWVDHDLTTILREIHLDVHTQKIVLAGHSQGTFYTNGAYEYLIKNGVPKESIAVYNIATPASSVAGDGKYLTSSTDKVISKIVKDLAILGFANKPLSPNIDIKLPKEEENSVTGGHDFQFYLNNASDRIIGELNQAINNLKIKDNPKLPDGSCFIIPTTNLAYAVQNIGYTTADTLFSYFDSTYAGPLSPQQREGIVNSLFAGIYNFGKDIYSGVNGFIAGFFPSNSNQNPVVVISNPDQASTTVPEQTPAPVAQFTGTGVLALGQDYLDDLLERNDLQYPKNTLEEISASSTEDNNVKENTGGGSGGGERKTYPKILISEVQISPTDKRFIELYNPNLEAVSLDDWYMQRKDANDEDWGTFVSASNFVAKTISAGGYFLISKEVAGADIFTNLTITADNSLALKNPNREVVDKLGFGNAKDPETLSAISPASLQSIGRKVLTDNTEQDTNNNLADFELNSPTPRAKNTIYVNPPIPDPEPDPNTQLKVLINEVQIAGLTDEKEEFVELYNPNDLDIDLTGWYLQRLTKTGTDYSSYVSSDLFNEKIIKANDYLLIGRQTSSFEGIADIIAINTLGDFASDGGSTLVLKRQDRTISDKVGFGLAKEYQIAPAKMPGLGQSIQRVQDTDNNAQDFEIFSATTPKAQKPKYYIYDNYTFSENITLMKSVGPYILKNVITVAGGVILTIEPGTIIKFDQGARMDVAGTLIALGTDLNKIVFTSLKDDDCGIIPVCGDTNEDGNATVPQWGEWAGIYFSPTSTNSQFDYSIFRYGGGNLGLIGAAVKADQSSLSILNSTFENNLNRGLYLINTSSIISHSNFIGQDNSDPWSDFSARGIDIFGGADQIANCYFKANNYGVSLTDWTEPGSNAKTLVQNNNFEENWLAVETTTFDSPVFSGNTATGTYYNAIRLSGIMTNNVQLAPDLPYLVKDILVVPEGKTLLLSPGVVMDFQSNWSGLKVDGTLKAIGSTENKIIFRHYFYYKTWTGPGRWMGLYFTDKSIDSELENAEIYLGGAFYNNDESTDFGAAVKVEGSSISLKNSFIHDNENNGVWLINSPATIIDTVSFLNHREHADGRVAKAVHIDGGSPEIKKSGFQSQMYGIYKSLSAMPNLHIENPDDPDKNTFIDTDVAGGDITTY